MNRTVLLLFLAGCSGAASDDVALRISDDRARRSGFRIDQSALLIIDARYRVSPGDHAERVEVLAPGGVLYSEIASEVTAGDDGEVESRGHVHVQGSRIEDFHLAGTWTFRLFVDGRPLAATTASLE
jgi:hypothetical protein